MQLELFDFVEESSKILEQNIDRFKTAEESIDLFFTQAFSTKDHFMDVKSRVKEVGSLKEKILRNNLFMEYQTPEALIHNLSDLIGVRIECRFIDDERRIYREIKNLFRVKKDDGYYSSYVNDAIELKMDEEQPQRQKNGFEIYKIDGRYVDGDESFNFELQIKSLVNIFWGDIDHKILYKNFSYSTTEKFLAEVMSSIKENLEMIDRELMILYNHINEFTSNVSENVKNEIKVALSKSLNEVYYNKVKSELGFAVDFKETCDTIINYLFMKIPDRDESYLNEFIRIINRLKFLSSKYIDIKETIDFPLDLSFQDKFTNTIGAKLSEIVNKDFNWNLFFRILFDLEEGSMEEIISNLISFLRNRYNEVIMVAVSNFEISDKIRYDILNYTMNKIANKFEITSSIKLISDEALLEVHNIVKSSLANALNMWDVEEVKQLIDEKFLSL
ncbi:MAG: GTP pyrophosphokinase [Firmicutes bacterium]|nr:GTP pyrophosphokinase [Bacillota bacterium]